MRADSTDNRWVGLAVLAEALNVGQKQARKIAAQEGIRTTRTRPAEYHWGDIVTTSQRRKAQTMTTTALLPQPGRVEFAPKRLPGRVIAFTPDNKAIVQTTIGRLTMPWVDNQPALDDLVAIQGTSSTGDIWTWIIIGPAEQLNYIEEGTPLARYTALVRAKAMEEAAGIAMKRNGGHEISIDLLTRSHEIRTEAGIR